MAFPCDACDSVIGERYYEKRTGSWLCRSCFYSKDLEGEEEDE